VAAPSHSSSSGRSWQQDRAISGALAQTSPTHPNTNQSSPAHHVPEQTAAAFKPSGELRSGAPAPAADSNYCSSIKLILHQVGRQPRNRLSGHPQFLGPCTVAIRRRQVPALAAAPRGASVPSQACSGSREASQWSCKHSRLLERVPGPLYHGRTIIFVPCLSHKPCAARCALWQGLCCPTKAHVARAPKLTFMV